MINHLRNIFRILRYRLTLFFKVQDKNNSTEEKKTGGRGFSPPKFYRRGAEPPPPSESFFFKCFTQAPMLYITCIVGVEYQLLEKSLVSIENSIHF